MASEHVRSGTAKRKGKLGGQELIGDATDAVGPEQLVH
jgi:hypothetical protein